MTRLEEIQYRESLATPGPWTWGDSGFVGPNRWVLSERNNCDFVQHAREDIPWLLEEYAHRTTQLAEETKQCTKYFTEAVAVGELATRRERAFMEEIKQLKEQLSALGAA